MESILKKWSSQAQFLGIAWLLVGCVADNPLYCYDDEECLNPIASRHLGEGAQYCHPVGHYCYQGCDSDQWCTEGNDPLTKGSASYCNVATHHCQESPYSPNDGGTDAPIVDGIIPIDGAVPDASADASFDMGDATVDTVPPPDATLDSPPPKLLGEICLDGAECDSGKCTEGRCCDVEACAECQSCNADNSGSCQPLSAGAAPAGQCAGDSKCGGGQCDGAGQCAYLALSSTCDQTCAGSTVTVHQCDATNLCVAGPTTDCSPNLCNPGGTACGTNCTTHGECVSTSLCDRTLAHQTGLGACVPTANIEHVTGTIQTAINTAISAAKTHVKVPANSYNESLVFTTGAIKVVGDGTVLLLATSGSSVVSLTGNGAAAPNVTLQHINLTGPVAGMDGLHCATIGMRPSFTIIESIIDGNKGQGIQANSCDATIRRSTISENSEGGVSLADGAFELTNNLVRDNGTGASAIGGIKLDPGTNPVTFLNNTVINNNTSGSVAGGVICVNSSTVLTSSILWGNDNPLNQLNLCTVNFSTVEEWASGGFGNSGVNPSLDANYKPTAPSTINSGDTAAVQNQYLLDIENAVRLQGGNVDMGAFEIQ